MDKNIGTEWTHVKTKGVYKIVGECKLEATNEDAFLYREIASGFCTPLPVWARSKEEFLDGRFELLRVPQQTGEE